MKARILVVDRSLTARMDLAETLLEAGHEPVSCGTLAEARASLAAGPAAAVLTERALPDGDGMDLVGAAPALVLLTAEDEPGPLPARADAWLSKPFDPVQVQALVARLLGPGEVRTRRSRVLLVDDSPAYREELAHVLREDGYVMLLAGTGEEGLRIAAHEAPDAIILDQTLPGISGPGVLRRIRENPRLRRIPVLLLTGSGSREEEVIALDSGADAFELKDMDTRLVRTRLAVMLRAVRRPVAPELAVSPPARSRLLVVDDSTTFRSELSDELRKDGYLVTAASSGEEALGFLSREAVDCILLDLTMPGLSGEDTCRRIKASPELRAVPVVMLTGREEAAARIDSTNAGADDFVGKSADREVLKAHLRAQLRRKALDDEHRAFEEQQQRHEVEAAEARANQQLAERLSVNNTELEKMRDRALAASRLNCQMPVMDGYEVTAQIRARHAPAEGSTVSSVPIIGLTASAMAGDRERCLNAGVNDYLTKPVPRGDFVRTLEGWTRAVDAPPERQAPTSASGAVDCERFDGLLEAFGGEALGQLVELMAASTVMNIGLMRGGIQSEDPGTVQRAAHALRGTALNLGGRLMAELCRELEERGRAGTLAGTAELLERVEQAWELTYPELKARCASVPPA